MNRALSVVLDAALRGVEGARGSRDRAHFTAELLDERHVPLFASAGDLTPYGAELLAEEVRQKAYGARVDLFVGPERAAALRVFANRQIDQLRDYGLAIHIHE
jgi:hypothetical protein